MYQLYMHPAYILVLDSQSEDKSQITQVSCKILQAGWGWEGGGGACRHNGHN